MSCLPTIALRAWCRRLPALVAVTLLPCPAVASGGADAAIRTFERMVTAQDPSPGRDDLHHCPHRWKSGVTYSVHGVASVRQRNEIDRWIQRLTQFIALPVQAVHTEEGGSLRIELIKTGALTEKNYKSNCSASRRVDRDCTILEASIRFPSTLDEDPFRYCLKHESLHALGIQGHPRNADSIMDPQAGRNTLSAWDWYVLELLYHPQLSGFANQDRFLREAANLIRADPDHPKPGNHGEN